MRRTDRLALMPVPHVMRSDHSERPCHPNQCTKPDEYVFQPLGRLESFMDEEPMQADGMSGANCDCCGCQKDKEPTPARRPDDCEDTTREHEEEANRLCRIPTNGALYRVSLTIGRYTFC